MTGFQFTDGRLARILQTEGADVSRGSGFYMHYLLLHHHITTGTSLMLACDSAVIAWTDGTEETPDMENDNKDREKQARIDAGFAAGEVTIRSVFHSDSYTLTLNVLKAGEQVVYDRTYTLGGRSDVSAVTNVYTMRGPSPVPASFAYGCTVRNTPVGICTLPGESRTVPVPL